MFYFRQCGTYWGVEGPMALILCAFVHPPSQFGNFVVAEFFSAIGRRHFHIRVLRRHADEKLAIAGLAGHNGDTAALQRADCNFALVEPQASLATLVIEAVALEALVGQDRPDVAIEIDPVRGTR